MSVLSLSRIRRGLRSPNLFLREANRLYHRRFYTRPYNTDGVDVFAEDWDTLVILDACRYDMFSEQSELPGRLESRISRGSSTVEFLRANVAGRDLRDTVYVTANPQLYRHREEFSPQFHDVIDVWQDDGWDEEYNTVLPETMVEWTRTAAERYPNKRILSHFIQPHYPFLVDEEVFEDEQTFRCPKKAGPWHQVMTGEISVSVEDVWQAYRATLDRTLPAVERLLSKLDGKTVVTADHGNMVGERAGPVPVTEWGHPRSIYVDQLVTVPWLVSTAGERRTITAGDSAAMYTEGESEVVNDRLNALGYK
jgi:hypothetical protein